LTTESSGAAETTGGGEAAATQTLRSARRVRRRDRYRCRDCGGRGRPVHLHHRRLLYREEEGLSRLLTLCHGCHPEIDRRLAEKLNA
jgi:hypothetical protein